MNYPNQKYLFIALFILILPLFAYGIDGRFEKKQLGPYKVSLSQEFKSGLAKIVIRKGNAKVFEEAGIDNHYSFGNSFDQNSNESHLYSDHNITGNGIPNFPHSA